MPSFYDFLNNSEGLIEILNLSIGDARMYLAVEALLEDSKQQNVPEKKFSLYFFNAFFLENKNSNMRRTRLIYYQSAQIKRKTIN